MDRSPHSHYQLAKHQNTSGQITVLLHKGQDSAMAPYIRRQNTMLVLVCWELPSASCRCHDNGPLV
jgi:hypothetical protein